MARFLKITVLLFMAGVLLCGVLAAVVVMSETWVPNLFGSAIFIDDDTITFSREAVGAGEILTAFAAVWFGFVVAALAVLFAFSVAGAALAGAAMLLLSPLILIALIVWLLMRLVPGRQPARMTQTPPPSGTQSGNFAA
jgi:hypothetical protein